MEAVDSGQWQGMQSCSDYILVNIPISNKGAAVDTALITLLGGKNANQNAETKFWVDYLSFDSTINNIEDEKKEDINISIFPNPTTGYLKIILGNQPITSFRIEVFDLLGRELRRFIDYTEIQYPLPSLSIDLSFLNHGCYFLKLSTADGMSATKPIYLTP